MDGSFGIVSVHAGLLRKLPKKKILKEWMMIKNVINYNKTGLMPGPPGVILVNASIFGSLAIIAFKGLRPIALRPRLSPGLPFRIAVSIA